jgi:hypothetical protein
MKVIISIILFYFVYTIFWGENSGCDKYSSKFSCKYVVEEATYDAYYWKNVSDGDESDEKYIGTTTGLLNCKNLALNYSHMINEEWNYRSYICILKKDGVNYEKHRYLS